MKRVILDTNIYGKLAKEKRPYEVLKSIKSGDDFVFYGIRELIRREVRETPRDVRILDNKSLRMLLLSLYDSIVKEHELRLNEKIRFIAKRYCDVYKEVGGGVSMNHIMNDFLIIACASLNNLDVVVSEDNATMLSEHSLKSYNIINKTLNLRTPEFVGYTKFKRWFSLWNR